MKLTMSSVLKEPIQKHSRKGEMRCAYKILFGKCEEKRSFRRQRHRWEDNIRMELRETGWEDVEWIRLAQDRNQWRGLVNTVMNILVPYTAVHFLD
jgi:hypothetical protein